MMDSFLKRVKQWLGRVCNTPVLGPGPFMPEYDPRANTDTFVIE